jgi:hypothetical protein
MKNIYLWAAVVLAVVVVGAVVLFHSSPQLAGDFPGGVLPTNLFTGNDAAGYVYPVGSLALGGPNGLYVGGLAANNETVLQYTATTSYPVGSAITLTTSTPTSTSLYIPVAGFSVGDPCSEISYNGVSSTAPLVSYDGNITAVGNGGATATILFFSAATASQTFSVTSTATGVSSTLKATCRHAGV